MSYINGIQQIGFGCENFTATWQWYIDKFGINIRILEDDTVAERMLPYTGGVPQKRHACIAASLQGGSGFEIWQYSERKPKPCDFYVKGGDLGVFAAKIRSNNITAFYESFRKHYINISSMQTDPRGKKLFWVRDPWGNNLQVVEDDYVFINQGRNVGGICGACIGVTDMEKSVKLYGDILGYSKVVYDVTGNFPDLGFMATGECRRVLLERPDRVSTGPFGELFGPGCIELVQCITRKPRKIYEGRYWGDPGFIQICFDVNDMAVLGKYLEEQGYKFTVDSCPDGQVFDMGAASGHFTYIEDPDGTLIEFVQTHKVPVLEKAGIFIDVDKRGKTKALPKYLFRLMGLGAIKRLK